MRLIGVVLLAIGGLVSEARPQDVLSVPDLVVDAGEFDLVLPIELASDQDLTRLRFDLTYAPAFCDALEDPDAIDFESVDRALEDPDDSVPIFCEDGQIRIDVRDDLGDVVIPAGSGSVVEIDFGSVRADVAGTFTFTLTNVLARAGGADVALTVDPGTLTIRAVAGTTTSTTATTTTSGTGPTVTTTSGTSASSTSTSVTASTTVTSTTSHATSTTTSTLPGACPDGRTFASLGCRLDALTAAAAELPPPFAARLAVAGDAEADADVACAAADTRLARGKLRTAVRALIGFRHRLGSLTARRRIAASVRTPLRDAALAILADLRPFKRTLFCPVSPPS